MGQGEVEKVKKFSYIIAYVFFCSCLILLLSLLFLFGTCFVFLFLLARPALTYGAV